MTMLYERSEQLKQLLVAAAEAVAGRGCVVLVTGEAGIGKSALTEEFLSQVDGEVLRGACDDLLMPPSFGPLREAIGPAVLGDGNMNTMLAVVNDMLDRARPTVLAIEDVHWADDATLDILRYMARRIADSKLLLLLTFRNDGLDARHPLRRLLSALATAPQVRISPEPLSRAALQSMAAGSNWNPDDLQTLTGGNPFFVTEALAAADVLPASLVDFVLARVHQLDPDGIELLEQLAVIPTVATHAFVEGLFDGARDALVEAERRGLLVDRRDGVAFRHEIARRAIEHSILPSRRRILNQNVVQRLLDQPSPELSAVLQHAVEARDTKVLLKYAPLAAAEATNAGAHRQALIAFETLLPHVERLDPAEQATLLEDYAWELHLAGRYLDAVRVCERATAFRENLGDQAALARSLVRQARHLYITGELPKTAAVVERAVEVAQTAGSLPELAAAETFLVVISVTDQLGDPMVAVEQATTSAAAAGRFELQALCLSFRGIYRCTQGDRNGLADMRAAIDLAFAHNETETGVRVHVNFVELSYLLHEWTDIVAELDRASELTGTYGYWHHMHAIEVHRATLEMRLGHWPVAERRIRRLIDSTDDSGFPALYSMPPLARLLTRRGDPDAEQILATIWPRALTMHSLPGVIYAAVAYLEWAWLNDRPDLAVRIRDELLSELPSAAAPLFTEFRRYLVRAGVPLDPALPAAAPQDGYALGTCGEFAAAAAYWDELGDQYERALELAELDDDSARHALEILERLGAVPAARKLRIRLKARGVDRLPPGIQKRHRANPANLTDRQLDILARLVKGSTNAEIAEELVLSVRTVDSHVAAVLQKLDAPNRRAAAAIAETLGLSLFFNLRRRRW
jgi:DNA-binding CsgD family transcriptional regulator